MAMTFIPAQLRLACRPDWWSNRLLASPEVSLFQPDEPNNDPDQVGLLNGEIASGWLPGDGLG